MKSRIENSLSFVCIILTFVCISIRCFDAGSDRVVCVIRHGDRLPMTKESNFLEIWGNTCWNRSSLPCETGQLSINGFERLRNLGLQMRNRYQFDTFNSELLLEYITNNFYFESTNYSRTKESGFAFFSGLLGVDPSEIEYEDIDMKIVKDNGSVLLPIYHSFCPKAGGLFEQTTSSKAWKEHENGIEKYREEFNISSFLFLYDTLRCYREHGIDFDESKFLDFNVLEKIIEWELNHLFSMKFSRISMSLFLRDVMMKNLILSSSEEQQQEVEGENSSVNRFFFFAHDTSIYMLLKVFESFEEEKEEEEEKNLGISDLVFGANVCFFSDLKSKRIRMECNQEERKMLDCDASEGCKFDRFIEYSDRLYEKYNEFCGKDEDGISGDEL